MSELLATGLGALGFSRGFLMSLLEATPDEAFFKVPCSGGNHPAWIVGHLALTDAFFLADLSGQALGVPESWNELFGMKTESVEDASKYPSRQELTERLVSTREAMIGWLKSLSDEQLLKPIEGDLSQFAKNPAVLMGTLAWHEGLHTGQIGVVRRMVGLPPIV
ncbi:MAG TPA: DinB family protein [Phycisphaerales bacterium]|nr:DinB family protein [Phycisphaerales bacterium]